MVTFFQNMKIKKKLIVVSLLITLIASCSGILGLLSMHRIKNDYSHALTEYGFAQGDAGQAMAAFCRVDGYVHDVVGYYEAAAIQNAQDNVVVWQNAFEGYMNELYPTLETDEAKALYEEIMGSWGQYKVLAEEIMIKGTSSVNSWVIKEAQMRLTGELDPLYQVVYQDLDEIMNMKVEEGNAMEEYASTVAYIASLLVVVCIVLAVLVSMTFGTIVATSLAKPMAECAEHLDCFAKGDFKNEVQATNRRDEVGAMLNSLHTAQTTLNTVISDACGMLEVMSKGDFDVDTELDEVYVGDLKVILTSVRTITREMSDTLAQITLAAEQVAAGAGQVSTGAQDLAQGAAEQASAVEQLSATITEIATQARKNAESSESAIADSRNAGKQVSESASYVKEMENAMEQISTSSEEIAKIIATIENIAFQTNILALNAAVEAARAGAAGKGFAVVADEVRNLASKSDEAAKATKELIERSVEAVRNGSNIMDRVSESLTKTVDYTNQVVNTVGKINEAMEAEADAINQVTDGIDQIAAVVQTNSATSEQSAAASQELSSQSALMKQKLEGINLYKGGKGQDVELNLPTYDDYEEVYAPVIGGGDKY